MFSFVLKRGKFRTFFILKKFLTTFFHKLLNFTIYHKFIVSV